MKTNGRHGLSLRAHLFVFGLAIVLPVLIFSALLFGQLQGLERSRTESRAVSLSENVAADIDREFARYVVTLRTLATAPSLAAGDLVAFRAQALRLEAIAHGSVVVKDSGGRVLMDTAEPAPDLNLSPGHEPPPDLPDGMLETGPTPSVSPAGGPDETGRLRFTVALPLHRGGRPAGTVELTLGADDIAQMLADEAIPPNWTIDVLDQDGTLLATSSPELRRLGERTAGAPAEPAPRGTEAPPWVGRNSDGRTVLASMRTTRIAPWSVRAWIPHKVLQAALQQSVLVLAGSGGLMLLLSLLLALFFGRRLARPVHRVAHAAQALSRGEVPALLRSPVREANDLSLVLSEAGRTLRERDGALRRAHDELKSITESAPVGIGLFDAAGTALRVNPAMATFGLPVRGGHIDARAWPPLLGLIHAVAHDGRGTGGADLTLAWPGGDRTFRASAFPVQTGRDAGPVTGVTLDDVSARRRAEATILESNARIQRLLDANFFGVAIVTEGRVTEANDAFLTLVGRDRAAFTPGGPALTALTPPEFQPLDERALAEVADTGLCKAFEKDMLRADGRRVPCLVGYARLDPSPLSVICFALDLTEQRQRETQRRYLMRELTHRTKNLLAVVQAMALQTAKTSGTADDFHERFAARLQGLAGSHDLLVQENWSGASIGDLVRSQLGHYADGIGTQIHLRGPRLLLEPEAAQNLGMALHELSTNAAKYGSLSVAEGRVDIAWSIRGVRGEAPQLVVEWRESGGPPVTPPKRKGFGHVVTARIAARALDGQVEMNFAPEGLWWRLTAPASCATPLDDPAGPEPGGGPEAAPLIPP